MPAWSAPWSRAPRTPATRVEKFTATELADADKPQLLRAYLRTWKMEVGVFFDGIGPDATDEQLLAIAPGYPVFRITRQ